ncbi:hypothetical protein SLA2020_223860 [Shorea laevis]
MESGLFSVLPWLTMALSANMGGWIADALVSRGLSVTTVCKLGHIDSPAMAVFCMACSQGVLPGLSNTAGVLAGVFGTAATGYILQHGSWDDVFKVSVGHLLGWNSRLERENAGLTLS